MYQNVVTKPKRFAGHQPLVLAITHAHSRVCVCVHGMDQGRHCRHLLRTCHAWRWACCQEKSGGPPQVAKFNSITELSEQLHIVKTIKTASYSILVVSPKDTFDVEDFPLPARAPLAAAD